MSSLDPNQRDALLNAYADGLMDKGTRAELEKLRAEDEDFRRQLELLDRVAASTRRQFSPREQMEAHWQELQRRLAEIESTESTTPAPLVWKRSLVYGLAAAAIAWLAVAWLYRGGRTEVFFEPRPLALVYREVVANGFEAYYECRDDARFAATFARRQGVALRLLDMPPGASMLGLSYPGGLSRETTAMLCLVEDRPVMVFVDRLEHDRPQPESASYPLVEDPSSSLHVFREQRGELVFYEVTPWDVPRMMHLLALPGR